MNKATIICRVCKHKLELDRFWKRNKNGNSYHHICKNCMKVEHNKYVRENKDSILQKKKERFKKLYKENPEKYKRYWVERNKNRYKNPEERHKIICRVRLFDSIKNGKIHKKTCEYPNGKCAGKIEAHHWDYSKPIDVVWFCRKHHELANKIQKVKKHGQENVRENK